ncbi:hypothetical protein I3F58_20720 [Streptomyces sp. MUM 203J]|uniref:hypothetical protein n=1 Tax=Streptomyces sp. MUM 203J TaxID=2791990 RepID=UPI001F047C9E|nr:hypothetical protein [Streptomyces sp. MUM 203J]MCH0541947.1 hypothetical protein [Streptomyces sp. MUM 203J]
MRALGKAADRLRTAVTTAEEDVAAWAEAAFERIGTPETPATEPWEVSLGALLATHPRLPTRLHGPIRVLDRFGAVRVGPDGIGFDAVDVPWGKAEGLHQVDAGRILTRKMIDRCLDQLRSALLGVPGRDWAVSQVAELLTWLVYDRAGLCEGTELMLPAEITYKSGGLVAPTRTHTASLPALAFLAASPETVRSLTATAEARGVLA